MDNSQENLPKKNVFLVYLLVIFFAMFVGAGIFVLVSNKPMVSAPIEQITIPTTAPTSGSFNLVLDPGAIGAVGQEFQVDLIADSAGKNISGYDLVLAYDQTGLDFVRATSNLADFKIYNYKKVNYTKFLGTKTLQSQNSSVFAGDKIASLFFKPLKAGNYNLTLKPEMDVDKTDLVTEQTEIINPQLNALDIIVN